jgi:cell division transport system permease protein
MLQGAAGGAFALALVAVLLAALNSELRPLAASYGSDFRFAFLPASASLGVLALAGGLGWLGAHLSVSRHLRNIEPR